MATHSLSKWKIAAFAMGNFGWCIATFSYTILITYFYYPPVIDGAAELPEFIHRSPVLFGATIVGLVYALNRIVDAVSDPIIANMSDKSQSRFGRRRSFMIYSFIPTALATALIFFPPTIGVSAINVIWLIACCVVVTLSLTMYTVPYMSLIPELGRTNKERVLISTFCSVTWALGFAFGQLIWVIKGSLQNAGYTPLEAIQISVCLFGVLGLIGMLIPIVAINEKRDCVAATTSERQRSDVQSTQHHMGAFASLKSAFKNRHFATFTLSNGLAFMSRFFLEVGAIYYITMLMGLPEAQVSVMMMTLFGLSFVLYPGVVFLSNRYSKKHLFQFALAAQGVLLIAFSFSQWVPNPELLGWSIIVLFAFPLAILGIIPNVIVADLAIADSRETGFKREALFYGANMFAFKAATSLTALVFPSIIILGSHYSDTATSDPTHFGVTVSAIVAGLLAFVGVFIMRRYNENEVLGEDVKTNTKATLATDNS
jgi:Na+/melibiose symporter-like transporter